LDRVPEVHGHLRKTGIGNIHVILLVWYCRAVFWDLMVYRDIGVRGIGSEGAQRRRKTLVIFPSLLARFRNALRFVSIKRGDTNIHLIENKHLESCKFLSF